MHACMHAPVCMCMFSFPCPQWCSACTDISHTYIHTYIRVYQHLHTSVCSICNRRGHSDAVHVQTLLFSHTDIHTYINIHTYIRQFVPYAIDTYIHTYIHIHTHMRQFVPYAIDEDASTRFRNNYKLMIDFIGFESGQPQVTLHTYVCLHV
jgi:hypothetical protein